MLIMNIKQKRSMNITGTTTAGMITVTEISPLSDDGNNDV